MDFTEISIFAVPGFNFSRGRAEKSSADGISFGVKYFAPQKRI